MHPALSESAVATPILPGGVETSLAAMAAMATARFPELARDPAHAVAIARAALRRWGPNPEHVCNVLGAAAAVDPELERVLTGDAPALIVQWTTADDAALHANALRALGLRASASEDGAVAAAREEGTVAALLHWHAATDRESRRRIVEAIGRLLGYPSCCVDALASRAGAKDAQDERAPFLRRPAERLSPLLHRLGRVRVIAHLPCSPGCAGSNALAEAALRLLRAVDLGATDRLLDAIAQPVLLAGDARIEIDAEWIGDTLEVERAVVLDPGSFTNVDWSRTERIELSPDGVQVFDHTGRMTELAAPTPLFTAPGKVLAPAARRALAGDASAEDRTQPLPVELDLAWLIGDGPAVFHGYSIVDVRGGERLQITFAKNGRSLVAWLVPADERPAFKKGAKVALGHDGNATGEDVALLGALWERAKADESVVADSMSGAPIPQVDDAIPRHSRPTRWRGDGPAPPLRLRVLGPDDAERFFHVDYEYGESGLKPTSRIGIIYRCNQWCSFCDLAEMDVHLSPEKVKAAIDTSRARGSERLILTGGEPTLSPHVVEYVAYAKAAGFPEIVLQTNAVRLSRGDLVRELVDAGLCAAQVSIHGMDAKLSDHLTQAPGTHERTLRGIDRLVEAGVDCLLNHLIFRANAHQLVAFVEMAKERWGHRPDLIVLQQRVPKNEFERKNEAREHLPPYELFAGLLLEARALARSYGFRVSPILDPTGVPSFCILAKYGANVPEIVREIGALNHHAWESDWFTRVDACKACGVAAQCQGVPRDYLEMFGGDEFQPLPAGAAG